MSATPKQLANLLLNLPSEDKKWILQNIPPETFSRWVNYHYYHNLKQKDFTAKIKRLKSGEEELSDLAKFELKEYDFYKK